MGKINTIALWIAVVVLALITLSGLSSTRSQFEQLKNAMRAQERFNKGILQQLSLQGEINESLLDFDGALINR